MLGVDVSYWPIGDAVRAIFPENANLRSDQVSIGH